MPGNSYYAANLAAFAERHSEMAAFVDAIDAGSYRVFRADSREPALEVSLRSGGNVVVGDVSDPRAAARKSVPDLPGGKGMFVLMGMGLGYLLFETLKRYPESRVLVIEQDARLFKCALGTFDWTEILTNPNVEILVSVRPERMLRPMCVFFANGDNDSYLPSVRVIKDDGIVNLSKDYYAAASRAFKRATEHYWEVYVGDGYLDALCGLKHVLANLRHLDKMIAPESYEGAFAGATGIVVASGPSMNDKYDYLRAVQDRVPIIAADSSLRPLLSHGIKPFGVACVERVEANAKLFFGYDIPRDVVLFAPLVIRPEVVASYPGPICGLFRQAYPFPGLPPLLPRWDMGLSCAHLAYQALRYLGCARVALVGQDLAYDRASGASHFAGAQDFLRNPYAQKERPVALDNRGTTIPTSVIWMQFRDLFEEFIARDRGQVEVVNVISADQGLAIAGTSRGDAAEFFSTIPEGEKRPEFDPTVGREFLAARAAGFRDEFAARRTEVLSALAGLACDWAGLADCRDAKDYFARKKLILDALSPPVRFLFSDLIKPHLKRFDAHAASIWDDAGFRENLPAFLDVSAQVISDLEDAWRQG